MCGFLQASGDGWKRVLKVISHSQGEGAYDDCISKVNGVKALIWRVDDRGLQTGAN